MSEKKKIKKWVWILTAIILIIVITISYLLIRMFLIKNTPVMQGIENPHGFYYLGVRPDNNDIIIQDDDEKIMAEQLYYNAALKCKNAENLAVHSDCQSIFSIGEMDNYIDVDFVIIKNQEKFFRMEYHLKNSVPLFESLPYLEEPLNEAVSILTSERHNYITEMEKTVYQKVNNNYYDEGKVPRADWSNKEKIQQEDRAVPIFNKNQEGIFTLTDHTVNRNTISEVTILYNEEEGFYKISAVLDVKNPETTQNSIHLIREGSGDDNADYSSILVNYEIWDNGYFRSLEVKEIWSAKVFLNFTSNFNYKYYFSYDEYDVNFETYEDAKDMINSL